SQGIAKISSCCNMKWVVMCSPTCMVAYTPWRFYDSVDTTNEPSSCLLPRGMRREVSHKSFPKVYEEENMRRTYKEERNLEGMRLGKLFGIFPLMYLSGGACSILVITGGKTIKQLLHIIWWGWWVITIMSEDDTEPLTTLQCFLIFSILAMVMSQFPNMNSLFGLSLVGSVMAVAYSTAVWTLLLASERNQNSVSYATKDTSHFDRPPKLLFLSNLVV
ncbi:unnamed protein product, partial [Brassica oleracea]